MDECDEQLSTIECGPPVEVGHWLDILEICRQTHRRKINAIKVSPGIEWTVAVRFGLGAPIVVGAMSVQVTCHASRRMTVAFLGTLLDCRDEGIERRLLESLPRDWVVSVTVRDADPWKKWLPEVLRQCEYYPVSAVPGAAVYARARGS